MKHINSMLTASLIVLMSLAISPRVQAQDENVADTWVMHIKSGQTDKFEAAFKKHIAAREKAGDPRDWTVGVAVVGDSIGQYVVRTCCTSWAEFDTYDAWSASNKMNEHWNKNVDQHVEEYHHYLGTVDFKNSHWPEDMSNISFVGVTAFAVKPGRDAALHAAKEKISQAAKAGNWPRHWSWISPSGGSNTLILASPYKNYAAMAPPEMQFMDLLTEQLGSAEAAQTAWMEFSDNHSGTHYTVYRMLPELSSPK